MRFTVVTEDGYVKVKRGTETICAAIHIGAKRLRDVSFVRPEFQSNNRTRQAAMRAYQTAGYR